MNIIETLTGELSTIAWKLVVITLLGSVLGVIYKIIEKKTLTYASNKAYERNQKKLEEIKASKEIHIERKGPTFEEWKATREKHPEK